MILGDNPIAHLKYSYSMTIRRCKRTILLIFIVVNPFVKKLDSCKFINILVIIYFLITKNGEKKITPFPKILHYIISTMQTEQRHMYGKKDESDRGVNMQR